MAAKESLIEQEAGLSDLQREQDSYSANIISFFLESLPDELLTLFVPQARLRMSAKAFPAFAARLNIPGAERSLEAAQALSDFGRMLDECLGLSPQGNFVRLGSRSPKDAYDSPPRLVKAKEVFSLFAASERIQEDVHWCYLYSYLPVFFIRPWLAIEPWREFRCIISEGRLIGISQYFVIDRPEFTAIADNSKKIAFELSSFIQRKVIPHALHASFVCDVLYDAAGCLIIDYNPLARATGLGLFAKEDGLSVFPEFRFLYRGKTAALPLPQEGYGG